MKYITIDGLKKHVSEQILLQLAATVIGGSELNIDLLESVNTDAIGEIDGYLRGVVNLPLIEPIDPLVSRICGDIMIYRLKLRNKGDNISDSALSTYKAAVSTLKDIQSGKIEILASSQLGDVVLSDKTDGPDVVFFSPAQKFNPGFTGFSDSRDTSRLPVSGIQDIVKSELSKLNLADYDWKTVSFFVTQEDFSVYTFDFSPKAVFVTVEGYRISDYTLTDNELTFNNPLYIGQKVIIDALK